LFKKIATVFLLAVSAVAWGNFLFTFLHYLAFGMNQDNRMLADLVSSGSVGHQYFIDNPVVGLEASPPLALAGRDKTVDFIAEVANYNKKYWAEFDWSFAAGSEVVQSGRSFILPDEKKYVMALGQAGSAFAAPDFIISKVEWRRIDQKAIKDWESFKQEHLNIAIREKEYISGRDLNFSGKIKIDQLKFTAVNMSPYNYREIKFAILLFRGGGIFSAGEYTLEDFRSGQERSVSLNWKGDSGFSSEIRIVPEVNILDRSVYLKFN